MITIETESPIAVNSFDHLFPCGALNDNSTDHNFINEIMNYYSGNEIKILDIGCAGGQFIVDLHNMGNTAVGIEGSDTSITNNKANKDGNENWAKYKNVCLFNADATKKYEIKNLGEQLKFDLITAWEVIEHIDTEDLEIFFNNIYNHLSDQGMFIGTISTIPCYSHFAKADLHRTVQPKEEWFKLLSNWFIFASYPFEFTLRCLDESNFLICCKRKKLKL